MNKIDVNKVFRVSTDKEHCICPPNQVFVDISFEYLLTIGGDLVDNEYEYDKLRLLLQNNGETEFYILENIGETVTNRDVPFQATISLDDDYDSFQKTVQSFDAPFGWTMNHFFVFGCSGHWGIYMSEYPTINIIGCKKELTEDFGKLYAIDGNGFKALEDFLNKEWQSEPNLKKQFINVYKL
jgi:hypothetical protein